MSFLYCSSTTIVQVTDRFMSVVTAGVKNFAFVLKVSLIPMVFFLGGEAQCYSYKDPKKVLENNATLFDTKLH